MLRVTVNRLATVTGPAIINAPVFIRNLLCYTRFPTWGMTGLRLKYLSNLMANRAEQCALCIIKNKKQTTLKMIYLQTRQ